jgi:hypothetical protein
MSRNDTSTVRLVALARLHGQLVHLYQAYPLLRSLTYHLSKQVSACADRNGWIAKAEVHLSTATLTELQEIHFLLLTRQFEGRALPVAVYPPTFLLTTDASEWGWAASLTPLAPGPLQTPVQGYQTPLRIQDRWSREDSAPEHINILETKAILLALKAFRQVLRGQVISLQADSIVALSVVRRLASPFSAGLNTLGNAIARLLSRAQIVVANLTYIPSHSNPMDWFSRHWSADRLSIELPLRRESFLRACDFFHVNPVVDAFATTSNAKVSRFWSRFWDPNAEAINAFDQSWTPQAVGGLLYLNPPFALLSKVVYKIIRDGAQALIVVPEWFSSPWWSDLHYCCVHPFVLRLSSTDSMERSVNNPHWNLRVLLVDGALFSLRA